MTGISVADGRYRLKRLLARGGMADVYLAHDEELHRQVAVKLLAAAGDDGLSARFAREARIAAGLSHPNVVAVYDAGEEQGRRYIVMEYVEGESLAEHLRRRGRLPPGEAVGLALQACAGLAAAHAQGLVHRDVKPQNLLLDGDGTLKVADFGIAFAAGSTRLTEHGTLLGTAAYIAPEQAAAEEVTPAADVYSLAAVLYEALAGRPPHEVRSLVELATRRESIKPVRELEESVPAHVEAAVMRALSRDPRLRPQDAAALAGELLAPMDLLEQATVPALPARRYESVPGSSAALWLGLAGAAAAVAAAIGLGVSLAGGDDEPERAPATPTRVEPVPQAATPEGQARNLSEWIRRYSR